MTIIDTIKKRIELLREQMKLNGVQAYFISGTDPHQNEYLPDYWQVRSFISGFTGSAGLVVVTMKKVALWTDSRYFLQAATQLKGTGIELMKQRIEATPEPSQWLAKILGKGGIVGTDLSCLSVSQFKNLKVELAESGLLVKDTGDLIAVVWNDRLPLPDTKIFEHELKYAGAKRKNKIDDILTIAETYGVNAVLITALDDLAWAFNLRGKDILYNPVFVGYAFVSKNLKILFINPEKLDAGLVNKLEEDDIKLMDYSEFNSFLTKLSDEYSVTIDPTRANQAVKEAIPQSVTIVEENSIPNLLKAQKSTFEIIHIRETMKKDGIAMLEFLYWLNKNLGTCTITEFDIATKLEYFRSKQDDFYGNSFFPIVGLNGNGAIIHRTVTKETAAEISTGGILLFDSGGQYFGGTTDITRTITLSEPTQQQKQDFTLVLKGMIGLSMAHFPAGTVGSNLDGFARKSLWQNGLNYGHGTGHGVGYFLNVHEGPMSIRQEYNEHTIKPGMVLSNEPGLYREGEYGIRIENVIICIEQDETSFGRFLGFDTLTLCPIDLNLIEKSMLEAEELKWLNDYHQRVFDELSPHLDKHHIAFLTDLTKKVD